MDPPIGEANSEGSQVFERCPIQFGCPHLSDVTITVREGEMEQVFKAHKMILANVSDVFRKMFYGDFKKTHENHAKVAEFKKLLNSVSDAVEKMIIGDSEGTNVHCIEISNVSIDGFRGLLEIIYHGKPSDFDIFVCGGWWRNLHHHDEHIRIFYHKSHTTPPTNFWSYVQDLLAVADQFNARTAVMKCFQEALDEGYCQGSSCFFCLNLYIFARYYELRYGYEWTKFSRGTVIAWIEYMKEFPGPKPDIDMSDDFNETDFAGNLRIF